MSQSLPGVRRELKAGARETAWGTEQENQYVKLQLHILNYDSILSFDFRPCTHKNHRL